MRDLIFGIGLIALLSFSAATLAQRSAPAEEVCSKLAGHADSRACLEHEAAHSLALVEAAEQSFREFLLKADETPGAAARTLAAFEDASREYWRYRRRQCDFLAALAYGGNGAGDRRLLCLIELDTRRVADLRAESKSGV